VIRIGEGPTTADRHETRVSDLREDHGWHSFCLYPPIAPGRATRDQAHSQARPQRAEAAGLASFHANEGSWCPGPLCRSSRASAVPRSQGRRLPASDRTLADQPRAFRRSAPTICS
jgi:hypothetical protein